MDRSKTASVALKSLELDASQVESLSEADLWALIGFLDYDARLQERLQEYEDSLKSPLPAAREKPCAPIIRQELKTGTSFLAYTADSQSRGETGSEASLQETAMAQQAKPPH